MDIIEDKVFRDNVHGYIHVPVDLVRLIVDTEIFQRLRNIEQTGMRTLYPSARHDRFIHSLGTFHLGSKAYAYFRKNAKDASDRQHNVTRKHYAVFDGAKNDAFWEKCGILFEIACLLHDCGHAPFSHTLEFLYEYPANNTPLLEKLLHYVSSRNFRKDFTNEGSQHERMSALFVCAEYKNNIATLLSGRGLNNISSLSEDIEFIVRMIIGCQYGIDTKENRIRNCLISLLNSDSIDVDSLDYIVRDSKLSGINNMSVDVDRLLNSLTLVEKTVFRDCVVRNENIKTNILNGSIKVINREKAHIIGKYHGVAKITNFDGKMTGSISATGHLKVKTDTPFIQANSNILKVGTASHIDKHLIPSTDNYVDVEIHGVTEHWFEMTGTAMDFNKEHNINIDCHADAIEIDSAFIDGMITGKISGELLGCYEIIGGKLTCELGFHKSSLSVIQNVLVARNYEYQWIYSHHKVVYYSNYLIIEMLRECIKFILNRNGHDTKEYEKIWTGILSWENMIKGEDRKYHPYEFAGVDYFRPVDSDILSLFKKCRNICMVEKNISTFSRLLTEFFTRVYKKSLWKSYAEYNIFFSFLSDNEKLKLYDLILSKVVSNSVVDQYGCFINKWKEKFAQFGLKNTVWVKADSKLKGLNPDNTCILFKDTTLNYRTVSLSQDVQAEQKMRFFYIYYEEVYPSMDIDIDGLKSFMHEQLKNFL